MADIQGFNEGELKKALSQHQQEFEVALNQIAELVKNVEEKYNANSGTAVKGQLGNMIASVFAVVNEEAFNTMKANSRVFLDEIIPNISKQLAEYKSDTEATYSQIG